MSNAYRDTYGDSYRYGNGDVHSSLYIHHRRRHVCLRHQ